MHIFCILFNEFFRIPFPPGSAVSFDNLDFPALLTLRLQYTIAFVFISFFRIFIHIDKSYTFYAITNTSSIFHP